MLGMFPSPAELIELLGQQEAIAFTSDDQALAHCRVRCTDALTNQFKNDGRPVEINVADMPPAVVQTVSHELETSGWGCEPVPTRGKTPKVGKLLLRRPSQQ